MASGTEIEVKIPLARASDALELLRSAGLSLSEPRLFEINTLYDRLDRQVQRSGAILRLRQAGERTVLTWKGRQESAKGANARRHTADELASSLGGAPDTAPVLREFFQTRSHKSREELETTIGSGEVLREILTRLGYSPVFRYEKYRTEFRSAAEPCAGVVTLDETPIGDFLEIEGPDDWIDRMAARLGFEQKDYVLESYGALYLADCRRLGVEPANMVFASH